MNARNLFTSVVVSIHRMKVFSSSELIYDDVIIRRRNRAKNIKKAFRKLLIYLFFFFILGKHKSVKKL